MVYDEKLKKLCDNFSLLNEDQQNYVLGIMQALIFACSSFNKSESADSGTVKNCNNP